MNAALEEIAEIEIGNGSLINEDLAPVPMSKRSWGTWNYAALWISMCLCIPTYLLAGSMIKGGMNWWEAILTILIGNLVLLVPMILNGHAGAKYGIPFPVFARASFGTKGANIPAILRAIVACGWFGIQTWIGGDSIYKMLVLWIPSLATLPQVFPDSFGLQTGPAICFFLFWLLNMFVIYLGVDSIKKLLVFKAFFLPVASLALLVWAITKVGSLGTILQQPSAFATSGEFWAFFFPMLTGVVGFWATVSLNITDFTRYAVSQKAQIKGQAIGLPPSMVFFSFIAIVTTLATTIIYKTTIWDPMELSTHFGNKVLVSFVMIAIAISTLATNIAANMVSPANDFANINPQKISFRMGGYITGFIGLLIFPWKLVADPNGYIFTWLIAYSSLLGPVGGIMIVDYFFIRKKELVLNDLYKTNGIYSYGNGINGKAIIALLFGIIPNIPGFLLQIKMVSANATPAWVSGLYNYAWFVGFAVSGIVYCMMMKEEKSSVVDNL